MKRNKKAFTLAEVSIAMAVIGIVATLILPLVVKNVQKLQTGPMLGRILEQIETGNQNIINLANSKYVATTGSYVDSLEVIDCADIGFNCTGTVAKNFIDIAPAFWGLNTTDIPKEDVLPIKKLDGTSDNTDYYYVTATSVGATAETKRYKFKKLPAAVAIYHDKSDSNNDHFIYIDLNGWDTMPNIAGKDIFVIGMDKAGDLHTFTSTEAGKMTKKIITDKFKVTYY